MNINERGRKLGLWWHRRFLWPRTSKFLRIQGRKMRNVHTRKCTSRFWIWQSTLPRYANVGVVLQWDWFLQSIKHCTRYIIGLGRLFMWTLHHSCVYIECCIESQLANLFIVLVLYVDRILQWWLHCNCRRVAVVVVSIVARQFRFILSWVEFTLQPVCMVFMRHHHVLHRSTAAALIVNKDYKFLSFIILKKD